MLELVSIPEERKPILIGANGETRKRIEKLTNTRLIVREDVEIEGEPIDVLKAKEVVKAVGRGFVPEIALSLVQDDTVLIITKITGSEKTIKRQLSRVIGSHGKARKNLEHLTGTHISIYGKTVSVIGKYQDAENTKKAIDSILSGSRHGYVYKHLESRFSKKNKEKKKENSISPFF